MRIPDIGGILNAPIQYADDAYAKGWHWIVLIIIVIVGTILIIFSKM